MKKLLVFTIILFVTVVIGAVKIQAADMTTTPGQKKARVVEMDWYTLNFSAGQVKGRLHYRVDIGDTATASLKGKARMGPVLGPLLAQHAWNARVFVKTEDGRWIHVNYAWIERTGREWGPGEFQKFIRDIEDEREVTIAELPPQVRDLPAELLSQVFSVWHYFDNDSITIYVDGDARDLAERIVAALNATRM